MRKFPFFKNFYFIINIAGARHGNSTLVSFTLVLNHTGNLTSTSRLPAKICLLGFLGLEPPSAETGKTVMTLALLTGTQTEVLRTEVAPRAAVLWASQGKARTA
uniref:Uncharacterized protein n=1 Tax=Mus musculus TaxID=10090 RepID=Q3UP19_MOUSE|nr:unnamed protein product [Mus musculus]